MAETLEIIRQVEELHRLEETTGLIHGLPRAAYTSEAFLRLEQERLFARSWVFAGFAHEMPEPGDVVPVTVAGQPVILVRDRRGEINAFHNICRHRGTKLVAAPCRGQKVLTCPYHSWTYNLDGSLQATPHFGGYRQHDVPGFDRARYGLKSARCAQWHDWIFVNMDADAPPFEEYVEPLAQCIEGVDLAALRPIAAIDFGTVNANWKLLMENFIEPYHVSTVHSTTASGQPLKGHFPVINGRCLGAGIDVTTPQSGRRKGKAEVLDMSARYLTLFPNFVLSIYFPDQAGVHLNVPDGPGRTRQRRVIYSIGEETPSARRIESLRRLWFKVHKEDHAICERLQEGRASPVMDLGGVLSPHWETSVKAFQRMVVDAIR